MENSGSMKGISYRSSEGLKSDLLNAVDLNTTISTTGPKRDSLIYRGYAIQDLAENVSFEEVVYLLLFEDLPSPTRLQQFRTEISQKRTIPSDLKKILEIIKKDGHPQDVLRTIVSVIGMLEKENPDWSNQYDCAVRLVSVTGPALLYWYHFSRFGIRINENPSKDDSIATNFLRLLTQKDVIDPSVSRALEICMISGAENTGASTLTCRVIGSTLSDLHSSITGAIAALKGTLHGGANEAAILYLKDLKTKTDVDQLMTRTFESKEKLMAFGHHAFKNGDPRNGYLKRWSGTLAKVSKENSIIFEMASYLESRMGEHKGLYPNIDYYTAVIYHQCGIPQELFTPIFAISRISGWCANSFEQRKLRRVLRMPLPYIGPLGKRVKN